MRPHEIPVHGALEESGTSPLLRPCVSFILAASASAAAVATPRPCACASMATSLPPTHTHPRRPPTRSPTPSRILSSAKAFIRPGCRAQESGPF